MRQPRHYIGRGTVLFIAIQKFLINCLSDQVIDCLSEPLQKVNIFRNQSLSVIIVDIIVDINDNFGKSDTSYAPLVTPQLRDHLCFNFVGI